MIKSLVILVLVLALAGGAFMSRPNQSDFRSFAKEKLQQHGHNLGEKIFLSKGADFYVDQCSFKDRLLWTTIERDGKTVYTGAFNHWWGSDLDGSK